MANPMTSAGVAPTDKGYPIRPSMIDAKKHLWDAFDNNETEVSAGWLVRFCQQRGGNDWRPFTYAEIDGYYRQRGHTDGFTFNRLLAKNRKSRPFVTFGPGKSVDMGDTKEIKPLQGEGRDGLILEIDGRYHFTHEFVRRCHESSPTR